MSALAAETAPMMELNTTPLIDVLLVLLVMLIITIPPQSHAVKLDLPAARPLPVEPDAIKNELAIAASGAATWNGVAVSDAALRGLLARTAMMDPTPELHLRPAAGARYQRVDAILALAQREGVRNLGFVGNQDFAAAF